MNSHHPINRKYCSNGENCDNIKHNIICPRKDMIYEPYNHKLYARDIEYIKKITTNAKNKSIKRVDNIILSISKIKKGKTKKYQYKDEKYELKQIIEFIEENSNLRYKLEEDETMFVNKLDAIIPSYDSECYREFDGPMHFINKKISRKYIIVTYDCN